MNETFKKEMRQYISSPSGAVFLSAYAALIGYYFTAGNLLAQNGEIGTLFFNISPVMMFLIPILTMRLFSEERKMRTEKLLLTASVSLGKILMGKYLAAFTMFMLGSLPLLISVEVLSRCGIAPSLETLGCIIAHMLMGCAFISIGLFASTLSENQIVSAIISYIILISIWVMDYLRAYINNEFISKIIAYLCVRAHVANLVSGVFSLSTLVYFVSLSALMLGLTLISLDSRHIQ